MLDSFYKDEENTLDNRDIVLQNDTENSLKGTRESENKKDICV